MNQPPTTPPERFAAAYEQHLPAILRYLRRRLGADAAEDAASEVFIRALKQRDSVQAKAMLPLPWLYAIAGNVISEQRRAERRRLKIIERITAGPASDFATYPQPAAELSPELAKALRKLSDTYRDALLLVAWGELSYDEAAGALGVPVGTVRSRVSRA